MERGLSAQRSAEAWANRSPLPSWETPDIRSSSTTEKEGRRATSVEGVSIPHLNVSCREFCCLQPQHSLYPTPPGHCQCCNHIPQQEKIHPLCQRRKALSCTVTSTFLGGYRDTMSLRMSPRVVWGTHVYECTHLHGWMNKPRMQTHVRAWGPTLQQLPRWI